MISRYQERAENYGKEVIRSVKAISSYSVIAVVIGLLLSYFMAGSWEGIGILSVAALACYIVGSGFGFLFSIPRSVQDSGKSTLPVANENLVLPRDNTNLEQISDWLVKILIGASLVELGNVARILEKLAGGLSECLAQMNHVAAASIQTLASMTATNAPAISSASTNAPPLASVIGKIAALQNFHEHCDKFCLFLILYFLALGFLTGYLITKLWLPYVMLRSSLAMMYLQMDADEDQARKEGARQALRLFGLTGSDNPPIKGDAGRSAGSESATGSTDDPNKGKFGGKAEAGGLKLSATVTKLDDIDDDYFRVILKVITDGKRVLTQPVTFHLHPTFKPADVKVAPVNNEAHLSRAAWGAFTVGVTVDGEDTKLELDLAELPGIPDLFKSR